MESTMFLVCLNKWLTPLVTRFLQALVRHLHFLARCPPLQLFRAQGDGVQAAALLWDPERGIHRSAEPEPRFQFRGFLSGAIPKSLF